MTLRQINSKVIAYECGDCGATRVKLWRDYSTFLHHLDLRCRSCAEKHEKKPLSKYEQIGGLVPAVPTYERDTFWGYSSVPPEDLAWWRALPERKAGA